MQSGRSKRRLFEQLEERLALTTYFVSNQGNDNQNGASATPWLTLQKAADTVVAGDTVIVRAGTYTGFDLRRDGTAASRITFSAEANVLINQRNVRTPDGINLEGADYVTIEGFAVVGTPRAGIRSVTNTGVVIRNNRCDLNNTWGILTGFSENITIENNECSRSAVEHGIYVSNSADNPTVRGNVLWGNNANGLHMNGDIFSGGGDGIISGALVENNTIYDNGRAGGSGINCDGVQSSLIRNNLIYNTHASGISLYRIDGGGASSGNVVVNNTVLVAADGRWALNIANASVNNVLLNNIFLTEHSFRGSITVSADSLSGLTSDYNVVMDRFSTDGGNTRITLAQWRSATGQDTHSIIATPADLFIDPAISNYQLKAGSPAIDIGTLQSAPNRDLAGTARPSGSGIDIGAYERLAQGTSPGVNVVGGRLLVGGGSGDDVLVITGVGSGTTGQYVVVFNQVSQTVSGVTGNMEIDLYGGNDQVTINNAFVNGSIEIDTESGHDQVTLGSQQIVSTRLTLSVLLGEGNDTLTGQRLYIGTTQSASGGDGNDQMSFLGSAGPGPFVLGTSSGGGAAFSGGLGNDRITVTYSFVVGAWQFIGGLNDDTISLRTSACNSAVSMLGDAGVDSLAVDTDYILGTLLIDGGADGDLLDLRNCLGITTATLQGAAGNDTGAGYKSDAHAAVDVRRHAERHVRGAQFCARRAVPEPGERGRHGDRGIYADAAGRYAGRRRRLRRAARSGQSLRLGAAAGV